VFFATQPDYYALISSKTLGHSYLKSANRNLFVLEISLALNLLYRLLPLRPLLELCHDQSLRLQFLQDRVTNRFRHLNSSCG